MKLKKMSYAELVEELRQVQQKQKCLVILDDIWTIETWNNLCEAFLKKRIRAAKYCLPLVIKMCLCMQILEASFIYELQHLNDKWSLELLEKIMSHRKGTSNI